MTTPAWAPWRMEYILGKRSSGCFFCEYPTDPKTFRANLVLVAQPLAFVCLNRYPFAASHLLVAPTRHVSNLEDLAANEYEALSCLVRDSVVRLKRAIAPQGANVGYNLGKAAGAGVDDHVHAHVVPRWEGDTNFMPVLADVRVIPEYLDETWRRLYPAFADLPGERAPEPSAPGAP